MDQLTGVPNISHIKSTISKRTLNITHKMNDTETIIKYLQLYNKWRRGDESMGQPNPTEMGKLIDEACEKLALLQQERDEAITRRMETIMQCELYEKERDEARESLKHITEYGTEEINAAVELRQKLATALVELGDVQKAVNGLCKHFGVSPANTTLLAVEVLRIQRERDKAQEQTKELIYIAERSIALAEIDFENDKFGVVSELRNGLEKIKEAANNPYQSPSGARLAG